MPARPTAKLENALGGTVAGVDEVGRGCLAGPVYAAAVILPPSLLDQDIGLRDSKLLSAPKREALAAQLKAEALTSIGIASVEEIDELNILNAALLAMRRAVEGLAQTPHACLIDGNKAPRLNMPTQCVVKGDQRSRSIAAASIIAKTARDAFMQQLHQTHSAYGWDRNAGYGTPQHLDAIALVGVTPQHRRGFKPVRERLLNQKP